MRWLNILAIPVLILLGVIGYWVWVDLKQRGIISEVAATITFVFGAAILISLMIAAWRARP
jgi:uncharacterized membrane protein required for colicin V production